MLMLQSVAKSGLVILAALVGVLAITALTITADEPPLAPAEEQIRRALDGGRVDGGATDGILADVLDIIGQEGSILDGSILDDSPKAAPAAGKAHRSQQAYAAEQLLKSARLLERLASGDSDRTALVNTMRAEAVKLLSE